MSEHGPKTVVAADGHVYHKSANANATTAPTNEVTKANAAKTAGLSSEQAEFVTIIDYEWHLDGALKPDKICKEYGFTEEEFAEFFKSDLIKRALHERGIMIERILEPETVQASRVAKLSPLQLVVANAIMDLTDGKSLKKKLSDLNVSTYQYNGWLNDPNFKKYLQSRAESLIGNVQHEAMLALVDQIMSGNLNAIKYYHEMTGRYVQASAKQDGTLTQSDFRNLIIQVMEIIQDEVHNTEEALRIADRLKSLATGLQAAGVLPTPEIITPEIAAPRELTPAVEDMMKKGLGYDT